MVSSNYRKMDGPFQHVSMALPGKIIHFKRQPQNDSNLNATAHTNKHGYVVYESHMDNFQEIIVSSDALQNHLCGPYLEAISSVIEDGKDIYNALPSQV